MNIRFVLLSDTHRRKCINIIPAPKPDWPFQIQVQFFMFVKSRESYVFSQGLLSVMELLFLESFPVICLNGLEHMHNYIVAIKQSVDVYDIIMQGGPYLMGIRSITWK